MEIYTLTISFPYDDDDIPWSKTIEVKENFTLLKLHNYIQKLVEFDIDLAIVFTSLDDTIDTQIELMKMRTDDDLLIEPHPFSLSDFNTSDPMVSEILKNGIDITNYAA